jgi:RsmE family RNA methyltransferase
VNLLLIEPEEVRADGTVRLSGRRARHAHEVLAAAPGERLRAGVLGGRLGLAEVGSSAPDELALSLALDRDPPPPAPLQLLLALPRPKVLRRVVQAVASMGVKRLVLCGSYRVERSYFGSPALDPGALRKDLVLGLEQGRDTILPDVQVRRLFKPLVEDELANLLPAPVRLLAHPPPDPGERPGPAAALPAPPAAGDVALAIGPEGGFTPYEAALLEAHGWIPFSMGERVLRVDTAIGVAAGMILQWLGRSVPSR